MKILAKLKMFLLVLLLSFIYGNVFANRALVFRTGIQSGNVSRFVLESEGGVPYNIFYLNNPNRIVVDIDDVDISSLKKESTKSGWITDVRVGKLDTNRSRVVLDLSDYAKVKKHFMLKPIAGNLNYRLVIDIEGSNKKEFNNFIEKKYSLASLDFEIRPNIVEDVEVEVGVTTKTDKKVETKKLIIKEEIIKKPKVVSQSFKQDRAKIIVLDPGHGGQDPGAIGYGGTQEKTIVLNLALQLRDILKKNPQYKVVMTRDKDVFIPLRERAEIGQKNNASLFISIHADSSPKKMTKGFSVYTLSERATDEESKKIAEKENAADLLGIGTFDSYDTVTKNILGDLMQTQVKIASVEMATEMVEQVRQDVVCVDNPNREAPFTVLRSTVPSTLVEMGFLSNRDEEKKLNQKWYREKLAYSLARAIDAILKE